MNRRKMIVGTAILLLLSILNFGNLSAAKVDFPAGEGIVEYLWLPYPGNTNNGYRITRTGLLYKNDYDQLGIQSKPEPIDVAPVFCNPVSIDGNRICFGEDYSNAYYHDGSERGNLDVDYQRGAIDFGMPSGSPVTSSSIGIVEYSKSCVNDKEGIVIVRIPNDTEDKSDDRRIYYLHLSEAHAKVDPNIVIQPGSPIGLSGECGEGVGAHLHIAVYDPLICDFNNDGDCIDYKETSAEIEIRFLDSQPKMINSEGLPIPQVSILTGKPYYIADEVKGGFNPNRPIAPIQFGSEVKVAIDSPVFMHVEDYEPPYDVETSVDILGEPYFTTHVTDTAKIIHAPINWGANYPFIGGGQTWWYVQFDEDSDLKGWVSQANMTRCLSDLYCDLSEYNVFYESFEKLHRADLDIECATDTYGNNYICSNNLMTRAQMAEYVYQAGGFDPNTSCGDFPDVGPDHPNYVAITTLKCEDIVSGYSTDNFEPQQLVTRREMTKFVSESRQNLRVKNGFGIDTYCTNPPNDAFFPDMDESDVFYDYTVCLYNRKYIDGKSDGEFHGYDYLTVGEGSKFVANALLPLSDPETAKVQIFLEDADAINEMAANGFKTLFPWNYVEKRIYQAKTSQASILPATYWTASNGYGVGLHVQGSYTITTFTTEDGLPSNKITAIDGNDQTGEIWAATPKGLASFSNSIWTIHEEVRGRIKDVSVSSDGSKVYVVSNRGFYVLHENEWHRDRKEKLRFVDADSTNDGFYAIDFFGQLKYFNGTEFNILTNLPEWPNDMVVVDDVVYMTYSRGLMKYENGEVSLIETKSNLYRIRSISAGQDGTVWVILRNGSFGTFDHGSGEWLSIFPHKTSVVHTVKSGNLMASIETKLDGITLQNKNLGYENLDGIPPEAVVYNRYLCIADSIGNCLKIRSRIMNKTVMTLEIPAGVTNPMLFYFNSELSEWEPVDLIDSTNTNISFKMPGNGQYAMFAEGNN